MPPDQRGPSFTPPPENPLSLPWRKGAQTLEEHLRRQSKNPTFYSMRKILRKVWERLKRKVKTGAPDRSRTCNLLIRSHKISDCEEVRLSERE